MQTLLPLTEILTELQVQTLHAAVDRIIPADVTPSGWDAGVGGYFAQLLTRESRFLFPSQQGLDALDAEARATEGAAFAALAPDIQDGLLTRIEAGQVQTAWPLEPWAFFRRLVDQTMEGFYADPGNGGNKDRVAWDMIGFRVTA
ncbi:MAG: gluconate 2-dehydrogenase subunit 3 family protein [Armatimonadota bacterium]|nr:gluconate 2-dehydrogenase subunit 3 family protein [Armatimonadota bacterium]